MANTNWEKNSTKPYLKRRPIAVHLLWRRSLSFISRYVANSRSLFLCLPCFPLSSSFHLFPFLGFISHGFLPLPWFLPFRFSRQSTQASLSQSAFQWFFFNQINCASSSYIYAYIFIIHFYFLNILILIHSLAREDKKLLLIRFFFFEVF